MDISQLGKQLGLGLLKQANVQPKLELVPGEVVAAKVVSLQPPNTAVLLLGGVQITAKINQLPAAAEQLSLRVVGQNLSTGQIEMQVVSNPDELLQAQTQSAEQTLPNTSFADWLQTLAKPDRQLAEQVRGVLGQAGIPAAPEDVKPIVAALSGQQPNYALIKTAVLSQALGLPLEPAVFQALNSVWNGPSMGTLLDEIDRNSEPAFNSPTFAAGPSSAQSSLPVMSTSQFTGLTEIYRQLSSALSEPDTARAQLLLKQSVDTLGLADDVRMYRMMRNHPDSSTSMLPDPVSLKQLLLAQLASEDQPAAHGQASNAAAGSSTVLTHLLNHFVGQQLLHGTHSESPFTYQNFAFPMYFLGGQTGSAHVHLLGRKMGSGGRQLDAANCTLFFRLDLPTLGRTDLYVQVIERTVSIRFTVEPDVQFPLMPSDREELQASLGKFGFRLGNVNASTRDETVAEDLFFYITEMRSRTTSIHVLA